MSQIRSTGDLNLAAALMSVGIPLDPINPCRIIEGDGIQRAYGSFHVMPASADGIMQTNDCMAHWSRIQLLNALHPFAVVCEFVAAHKSKNLRLNEWFDAAMQALADAEITVPGLTGIEQIKSYVDAAPRSPHSYILAFVANRKTCLEIANRSRRMVYMTRGSAHAIISTTTPKPIRNELLARLDG